jgi:HPt (histidine-containing phosphotransfer) domain-containing protein
MERSLQDAQHRCAELEQEALAMRGQFAGARETITALERHLDAERTTAADLRKARAAAEETVRECRALIAELRGRKVKASSGKRPLK